MSLLNTINKKNAIKVFNGIFKQKKIYSKKLTEILEESKFKNKNIDFLNIDCEGSELDIIKSLNFKIYSPKLICIEIAENARNSRKVKKAIGNNRNLKKNKGNKRM